MGKSRVVKNAEVVKKKLLAALERSLGVVTPACREVGIGRSTFYAYLNEDQEFRQAVEDTYEVTLDFVENQLLKKIKEGSERSIIFFMKHKAKKRGYTDSLDITTNGDKVTEIRLLKVERNDWEDGIEDEA